MQPEMNGHQHLAWHGQAPFPGWQKMPSSDSIDGCLIKEAVTAAGMDVKGAHRAILDNHDLDKNRALPASPPGQCRVERFLILIPQGHGLAPGRRCPPFSPPLLNLEIRPPNLRQCRGLDMGQPLRPIENRRPILVCRNRLLYLWNGGLLPYFLRRRGLRLFMPRFWI